MENLNNIDKIKDKIIYIDDKIFFLDSDIATYLGLEKELFNFKIRIFEKSIPKRYYFECSKEVYTEILFQRKQQLIMNAINKKIEDLHKDEVPPIPGQVNELKNKAEDKIKALQDIVQEEVREKKRLPNLLSIQGLKIIFLILRDKKVRERLDELNQFLDQVEEEYRRKMKQDLQYAQDIITLNKKIELINANQEKLAKVIDEFIKGSEKKKKPISLI